MSVEDGNAKIAAEINDIYSKLISERQSKVTISTIIAATRECLLPLSKRDRYADAFRDNSELRDFLKIMWSEYYAQVVDE